MEEKHTTKNTGAEIHGLVDLRTACSTHLGTAMHQISVVSDLPKPTAYSNQQYFTQAEWDAFRFAEQQDMTWWLDAKLGLFIHWGPCSLIGTEIGWSRGGARGPEQHGNQVPVEIYDQLYHYFDPQRFDADEWVRMARDMGAGYIVLITKHHDGFCLWNTKTTDYNIMNTPFGRDVTKELSEACARADMPFGVYFSQRDWYHPAYFKENHQEYVDYMREQVRELLTGYGKVRVLWLDAWYPSVFEPEHWDSAGLCEMARELQPGILINNRTSLPGDYDTPEGVIGSYQVHRPWETTTSIHDGWSWNSRSHRTVKSLRDNIALLAGCAVGGGNLIYNAGPMANGRFEDTHIAAFHELGEWLRAYGESIYGTRGGPFPADKWGGFTVKGDTVYVHILYPQQCGCMRIFLPRLDVAPIDCQVLTEGEAHLEKADQGWTLTIGNPDPNDMIVRIRYDGPVPFVQPDPKNPTYLLS